MAIANDIQYQSPATPTQQGFRSLVSLHNSVGAKSIPNKNKNDPAKKVEKWRLRLCGNWYPLQDSSHDGGRIVGLQRAQWCKYCLGEQHVLVVQCFF